MIIRKNFKRDEVLLKVKNRLEASNLELRLRLMQHEVERRKDRLKREMGQIIECQYQCKRSSGDSVGIYWDLVLNSHLSYSPAYETAGLSNCYGTGSDANVSNQDQDSDANFRWKKLQRDTCQVPKARITAVKQAKTHSKHAVPLTKSRKSGEETSSAHSLKMEKFTQTLLNNGRRKSLNDETDADKDRNGLKYLTEKINRNQLSNLCPISNVDDGNSHAETFSGKIKLPKIVTFPSSSSPPEARKTSVSFDKNDAGSPDTKNRRTGLSALRISSKESTKGLQSLCDSVTNKAFVAPKQTIEQPEGSKSFKLPTINAPLKSVPNILERSRKRIRSQNGREMTDIIRRIASELKLESPSPLFGKLALTDGGSGKTKHSGCGGKTNLDSSDPNDPCGPPNRLMQKGRFFPEHMSYSDMSDDSKSQSSSTDDSPYILYRGRKLKNYVKPQDRFRVDQLTRTWKKQQLYLKLLENRPDDLTKCSLRWDPALGDSDSLQLSQPAKKKALERMVEENMTRSVPSGSETDHTELNNRVKEFMDSLGNNSDGFFL